jgi:hypothetical protein
MDFAAAPISLIEGYLESQKAIFRRVGDTSLVTGFLTDIPYYQFGCQFEVRVDGSWVALRAFPNLSVPSYAEPIVAQFLMETNAQLREIRCCLVEGAVVVVTELPLARCTQLLFFERLWALIRQIAFLAVEVGMLINDEHLRKWMQALLALRTRVAIPDGFLPEDIDVGFEFNPTPNTAVSTG